MRLPNARTHKLTIRELPDETLVYDHLTAKAHCLNRTAAMVWRSCNGTTTVRELSVMLQRELGIASAEPVVHLTLEKLARRRLLDTPAELPAVRQDRRKVLRKLALAALPVILTMTAPRAAQAASKTACGPSNCSGCCDANGICQPGNTSPVCGKGGKACINCGMATCGSGGCLT